MTEIRLKAGTYFFLIIAGIFLLVISPSLLSEGMFLDGTIYATLSRNLAIGSGSFWEPHFTDTLFPVFVEHPPLATGIESLFFRIFGDKWFVERLYSLMTILATGTLIVYIWKHFFGTTTTGWLPLLFWISMESVSWSAVSNMLENTLVIFICLAVLFYLKSLRNSRLLFIILSGIMLSLGFLTKGFVTFTPLALPFFAWVLLRERKFSGMVFDTVLMIISTLVPLLLLYLFTGARDFFPLYINFAVHKISDGVTAESRFFILEKLLMELLPSLLLIVVVFLVYLRNRLNSPERRRTLHWAGLFLLLGLAGVLPILATMDQSRYFLLLSLPFFALAFGFLAEPAGRAILLNLDRRPLVSVILKYTGIVLVVGGLLVTIFYIDTYNRDESKLKDMKIISAQLNKGSTVNILPEMHEDWSLHAYWARYFDISLDQDLSTSHKYLLINRSFYSDTLLSKYNIIELNTLEYDLFRLKGKLPESAADR